MQNENYYAIEQIADSAWKIYENLQVSMYLVCGKERACLIDTGYGGGDLVGVVRSLTDLPLVVVCTHGHIDHVLGNRLFPKVLLHSSDHPLYREVASGFAHYIEEPWVKASFSDALATLDVASVRFAEAEHIGDGDIIDLGGKQLEVILMPGHTAGSILLLDRADKIVYSGDSIMENPWLFLDESQPNEVYLDSLRRAKQLLAEAGITRIYNGHYAYEPIQPALLDTMIAGMESIIAGTATGEHFENGVGSGLLYRFEGWSVYCCDDTALPT